MIDLKKYVNDRDKLVYHMSARGMNDARAEVRRIMAQYRRWQSYRESAEYSRAEIGKKTAEFNKVRMEGGPEAAAKLSSLRAQTGIYKDRVRRYEEFGERWGKWRKGVLNFPNVAAKDVPDGLDETSNVIVATWGTPKQALRALDHSTLGQALGGFDFEAAARMSGSRHVVMRGSIARLERALGQFMLDHNAARGFVEHSVPLLVNEDAMVGTGQLPKFKEDAYKVGQQYLIPTSEVSLTNTIRETTIPHLESPMRMTALTPCFRSEAGSAGRDTIGLIRQHQFNKVELVSIVPAEQSEAEHQYMVETAELILQALDLPYQKVLLCKGDMGFSAQKTYDLEVWVPSQKVYREISSVSNCGDFQARRMNARMKRASGKGTEFPHTLNGSALAVGRTLVAVMENYQEDDGSIVIPKALVSYMGGKTKINTTGELI